MSLQLSSLKPERSTGAATAGASLAVLLTYFFKLPSEVSWAFVGLVVYLLSHFVPDKFVDKNHNEDLSGD